MKSVRTFPIAQHEDERGYLSPFWRKDIDYGVEFVEDRVSYSRKGVLRGLHGDSDTWKLIVPIHGVMQFFVTPYKFIANEKPRVEEFILDSKENPRAILVPPYHLNGHLCLSEDCVFLYKWSSYYKGADAQVSVRYNDPQLKLDWKIEDPILSTRDSTSSSFDQVAIYEQN